MGLGSLLAPRRPPILPRSKMACRLSGAGALQRLGSERSRLLGPLRLPGPGRAQGSGPWRAAALRGWPPSLAMLQGCGIRSQRHHGGGGPGLSLGLMPSPSSASAPQATLGLRGATPPQVGASGLVGLAACQVLSCGGSVASSPSPQTVVDGPTPHFSIWCPFFLFCLP